MKIATTILAALVLLMPVSIVRAGALDEIRYCGPPKRNAAGEIVRRADVKTAFRKAHPCPVRAHVAGVCPGWEIDHVIPLACGGCDAVSNMQWLPLELKRSPNGKDGFEREIYGGVVAGTSCTAPSLRSPS